MVQWVVQKNSKKKEKKKRNSNYKKGIIQVALIHSKVLSNIFKFLIEWVIP